MVYDPEKFERKMFEIIDRETQERVSEFCFREIRRQNNLPDDSYKFDIDDVRELSGDITSDIGMTLLALSEGMDVIPSYTPMIGKVLELEIERNGEHCHEVFSSELIVPDFDAYSWNEILELRNDDNIKAFRMVIYGLLQKNNNIDRMLFKKILSDLWSLVTDVKPNVRQTILEAIGSNLPSPIGINPIGIATSLRDICEANCLKRKFGHIFFVQQLKEKQS